MQWYSYDLLFPSLRVQTHMNHRKNALNASGNSTVVHLLTHDLKFQGSNLSASDKNIQKVSSGSTEVQQLSFVPKFEGSSPYEPWKNALNVSGSSTVVQL